jgi:hypothetical protein
VGLSVGGLAADADGSFLADVRALTDLLDGFVLTVPIVVAIGTIYYAIRLVKELRRSTRR